MVVVSVINKIMNVIRMVGCCSVVWNWILVEVMISLSSEYVIVMFCMYMKDKENVLDVLIFLFWLMMILFIMGYMGNM